MGNKVTPTLVSVNSVSESDSIFNFNPEIIYIEKGNSYTLSNKNNEISIHNNELIYQLFKSFQILCCNCCCYCSCFASPYIIRFDEIDKITITYKSIFKTIDGKIIKNCLYMELMDDDTKFIIGSMNAIEYNRINGIIQKSEETKPLTAEYNDEYSQSYQKDT
mmetsp:Transcript_108623/g.132562  ORF Transcript_108623/g.132562 Transcript_108623/m.132562 type:complete len:163 (+) Transcript_108623:24-512(+)